MKPKKNVLATDHVRNFILNNLKTLKKINIDSDLVENILVVRCDLAESLNLTNNEVCEFTLQSGRVFLAVISIVKT